MTQTDRVLHALRARGGKGICTTDFLLPAVCDGGAPITRLAARIQDLKQRGYIIATAGERHGCAVYILVREPSSAEQAGAPGAPPVTPNAPAGGAPQPLFTLEEPPVNALLGDVAA